MSGVETDAFRRLFRFCIVYENTWPRFLFLWFHCESLCSCYPSQVDKLMLWSGFSTCILCTHLTKNRILQDPWHPRFKIPVINFSVTLFFHVAAESITRMFDRLSILQSHQSFEIGEHRASKRSQLYLPKDISRHLLNKILGTSSWRWPYLQIHLVSRTMLL